MVEIEARHRAAARKYEAQYKVAYSWAPVWDGTKFVAHAWAPPPMLLDYEQRHVTACGLPQMYPATFVVSGAEPYCEACRDVVLEPLARAFAECATSEPRPVLEFRKIAGQYGVDVAIVDDTYLTSVNLHREDFVDRCFSNDSEIILGLFRDEGLLNIAFFHELALMSDEAQHETRYDQEADVWKRAFELAEKHGVSVNAKMVRWALDQLETYCSASVAAALDMIIPTSPGAEEVGEPDPDLLAAVFPPGRDSD